MDCSTEKEVYFYKYCNHCKYGEVEEGEDPCNACLTETVNTYSHKPLYFKESENTKSND